MGLDQSIYRISKPELEDRVFKRNELNYYNYCSVDENEEYLHEEILPYVVIRKVETEMMDLEKMFADKGIPNHANLGMMCSEYYKYYWEDGEERKSIEVKVSEITEKYIKTEILDMYIWEQEELYYWRKNYEVQDYIYDVVEAENCKYCLLSTDIQRELIDTYGANFEVEENTEDSGIFYWEWY